MPMKLTASDLREMANTIETIEKSSLCVEVVMVRGHRLVLAQTDDQRDGLTYHVTGITSGKLSSSRDATEGGVGDRKESRPSTGRTSAWSGR